MCCVNEKQPQRQSPKINQPPQNQKIRGQMKFEKSSPIMHGSDQQLKEKIHKFVKQFQAAIQANYEFMQKKNQQISQSNTLQKIFQLEFEQKDIISSFPALEKLGETTTQKIDYQKLFFRLTKPITLLISRQIQYKKITQIFKKYTNIFNLVINQSEQMNQQLEILRPYMSTLENQYKKIHHLCIYIKKTNSQNVQLKREKQQLQTQNKIYKDLIISKKQQSQTLSQKVLQVLDKKFQSVIKHHIQQYQKKNSQQASSVNKKSIDESKDKKDINEKPLDSQTDEKYRAQIAQANKKIQQLASEKQQMQNHLQELKKKVESLQSNQKLVEMLKRKCIFLEKQLEQKNSASLPEPVSPRIRNPDIGLQQKDISDFEIRIAQLQAQNQQLMHVKEQKEQQVRQLLQTIDSMQHQKQQIKKISDKLQSDKKQLQDDKIALQQQLNALMLKLKEVQTQLSQVNQKYSQQVQERNNFSEKLEKMMKNVQIAQVDKEKIATFNKQIQQQIANNQANINNSKIKQQNIIKQIQKKMQEKQQKMIQLNKGLYTSNLRAQSLQQQLTQVKDLLIIKSTQLSDLKERQAQKKERRWSFIIQRTLFIGEILEDKQKQKKYLITTLQKHMKQDIQKTKMLYEYKRDRKTNFHDIVDGLSNIVLVIQTEKALIAAYYAGQIKDKGVLDEQGLIISLNNLKYYTKKNDDKKKMRGMTYDKYYLIYGNAEVRVRSGDNKVFSNFGINTAFFDSRKDKVNEILGQGTTNEVQIINYELHQVVFDEKLIEAEKEERRQQEQYQDQQ